MCTDAYLEEHPCDIPWLLGEHGACNVLIEDHIRAHGPSRQIFMAYHAWASLICLALSGSRLASVWSDPLLRRYHYGLGFLAQPQLQRAALQTYGTLALALQAIDVRGYGGRLGYPAWSFLFGQSTVGLGLATIWTLCLWLDGLGQRGEVSMRQRRASALKAGSTVLLLVSNCVLLPAQIAHRPSDAALGVVDARIYLATTTCAGVVLLAVAGTLTYELVYLQRARSHARAEVAPGTPRQNLNATSDAAAANGKAPRTPQLRATGSSTPLQVNAPPATSAIHQLRKFTALAWVMVLWLVILEVISVANAPECWRWRQPPETQYFHTLTLGALFGAAALAVNHMKTYECDLCACGTTEVSSLRESQRIRVHPMLSSAN